MVDSVGNQKATSAGELIAVKDSADFNKPHKKDAQEGKVDAAVAHTTSARRARPALTEPISSYAVAEALALKLSKMIRESKELAHNPDPERVNLILEMEEALASEEPTGIQ